MQYLLHDYFTDFRIKVLLDLDAVSPLLQAEEALVEALALEKFRALGALVKEAAHEIGWEVQDVGDVDEHAVLHVADGGLGGVANHAKLGFVTLHIYI